MYYMYIVALDKEIPDWKKKPVLSKIEPDANALGYCNFVGEDLYNKNVHTFDGKQVPVTASPIKCSNCNQYVFKDDTNCTPYIYNILGNTNIDDSDLVDKLCDPMHPERSATCIRAHGTCTASKAPSSLCQF